MISRKRTLQGEKAAGPKAPTARVRLVGKGYRNMTTDHSSRYEGAEDIPPGA